MNDRSPMHQRINGRMAGDTQRLARRFHILSATIHSSKHGSQVDAFIQVIPINVETKQLVVLPLRVGGIL